MNSAGAGASLVDEVLEAAAPSQCTLPTATSPILITSSRALSIATSNHPVLPPLPSPAHPLLPLTPFTTRHLRHLRNYPFPLIVRYNHLQPPLLDILSPPNFFSFFAQSPRRRYQLPRAAHRSRLPVPGTAAGVILLNHLVDGGVVNRLLLCA